MTTSQKTIVTLLAILIAAVIALTITIVQINASNARHDRIAECDQWEPMSADYFMCLETAG